MDRASAPPASVSGRIDFSPLASRYDAGRSLPDWATDPWRDVIVEHAPQRTLDRVVDVGCGTGFWLPLLAAWLDAPVVGVELSGAMAAQGREKVGDAPISISQGRAEALPLRSSAADALWISNVLHHVPDLVAAARECRRVLVDDGAVLLRTYVTDLFDADDFDAAVRESSLDGVFLTGGKVFPSVNDVLASYPSIDTFDEAFATAGLERAHASAVVHGLADNVTQFADRLALRADTTLQLIADDEFDAGMAKLRADIESDPEWAASPVIAPLPFLVYR